MKGKFFCIWIALLASVLPKAGRGQDALSQAQVKTIRGQEISFTNLIAKDKLVLVCFWSTHSEESISQLQALSSHWQEWKSRIAFRLLAVCVDEGAEAHKVKPMANVNEWMFEIFLDDHGALRSALHSNNLPQCFLLQAGKTVYEQSGYQPGSENYLFQRMISLYEGRG